MKEQEQNRRRVKKEEKKEERVITIIEEEEEETNGILKVKMNIEGERKNILLDTGAACNTIDEETLKKLNPQAQIQKTKMALKSFNNGTIGLLGSVSLQINMQEDTNDEILAEEIEEDKREESPTAEVKKLKKILKTYHHAK
jgi:hypothetical protein